MMYRTATHCSLLALVLTCGLTAADAIGQPATRPATPATRPAATTQPAAKPAAAIPPAATQPAKPTTAPATSAPAATRPAALATPFRPVGVGTDDRQVSAPAPKPARLWPSFDAATMAWFAAIVILALSIRPRQLFTIHTFDALVLAGVCLLMLYRSDTATQWGAKTAQWWSYLGLTIAVAYWIIRGFVLIALTRAAPRAGNLPAGPTLVLFLAGLALCLHQIATAPLSESARDGVVGGLYVLDTGQLPYGEAPAATRHSPVVALLHAGACRLTPPALPDPASDRMIPMTWSNRDEWIDTDWTDGADTTAARLVCGVLFLCLLSGVLVIGQRLYSAECGLEMAALLCVFPGTLECINDPSVLASAALIAVATSLTLLPGLGGLLGTFAFAFAGLAWPWAWLGIPIVLAYSFRHGLQALGGVLGLAAGVVLLGTGVSGLVEPTLPSPLGALRVAGQPAAYAAGLDRDNRLVVERRAAPTEASEERAMTAFLWRSLLAADDAALKPAQHDDGLIPASLPADLGDKRVLFRELAVHADALPRVQEAYRQALAGLTPAAKFAAKFRTAIEAVWLPTIARTDASPTPWALWSQGEDDGAARWLTMRRVAKVVAVLLALAAALAIYLNPRPRARQVAGALLGTIAAVMLATSHGAAAHLLLLAPAVLMAWAAYDRDAATQYQQAHQAPAEPEPRITVGQ